MHDYGVFTVGSKAEVLEQSREFWNPGKTDFWSESARRVKVKTPLEFVVSAMRAADASPDTTPRLGGVLQSLGQPLFQQQVPTGGRESMVDELDQQQRVDVAARQKHDDRP